eukprot:1648791-Pyramimonas_sp.AAC.1
MWIKAYVPGGFILGSIYLPDQDPLGPVGSQILSRIDEQIHSWDLPLVLGGDWNVSPEALRAWAGQDFLGDRLSSRRPIHAGPML